MPRMSGPDALREIHARVPAFPAVLMSGYDAGLAHALPHVAFVSKPFRADRLLDTLHHALEAARATPASKSA